VPESKGARRKTHLERRYFRLRTDQLPKKKSGWGGVSLSRRGGTFKCLDMNKSAGEHETKKNQKKGGKQLWQA